MKILMLDNNEEFLVKARDFLLKENKIENVITTSNHSEALRIAHDSKPDVVLLDVLMPTKNGIDLIPEFREACPDTKIIMLSLWDINGYQNSARTAGADGYISKKKMMDVLIPTLEGIEN